MKKKIFLLPLLALVLAGCNPPDPAVPESVVITPSAAQTIKVGETLVLQAKVLPADATQTVVWSSDNEDAATVVNGTVTAVAEGDAKIYATSSEKDTVSAYVEVKVEKETDPDPDPDGKTLLEYVQEGAQVIPSIEGWIKAMHKRSIVFGDESANIFCYLSTGDKLTAILADMKVGDNIEIKDADLALNGTQWQFALANSTVSKLPVQEAMPAEVAVNVTAPAGLATLAGTLVNGGLMATKMVGKDMKISEYTAGSRLSYVFIDGGDSQIPLTSFQTLADLETGAAVGKEYSEVKGYFSNSITGNNTYYNFVLNGATEKPIEAPKPASISLNHSTYEFGMGEAAIQLIATVKDQYNAVMEDQTIAWSTSDDTKVSVVNGLIAPVAVTEAAVTIKAVVDGVTPELDATCAVTVKAAHAVATGIAIDGKAAIETAVTVGHTATLSATVSPDDASRAVVWSSDAPAVMSVNADTGAIEAKTAGEATISVVPANNPGAVPADTITYTVSALVKNIAWYLEQPADTVVNGLRGFIVAMYTNAIVIQDDSAIVLAYNNSPSISSGKAIDQYVELNGGKMGLRNASIQIATGTGLTATVIDEDIPTPPAALTPEVWAAADAAAYKANSSNVGQLVKIEDVEVYPDGSYFNLKYSADAATPPGTAYSANQVNPGIDANLFKVSGKQFSEIVGITIGFSSSSGVVLLLVVSYVEVPSAVTTVEVSAVGAATELAIDADLQMSAVVKDQYGIAMAAESVTWSVDEPTRATINATTGLLHGEAVGDVVVTATSVTDVSKKGTYDIEVKTVVTPPTEQLIVQTALPASAASNSSTAGTAANIAAAFTSSEFTITASGVSTSYLGAGSGTAGTWLTGAQAYKCIKIGKSDPATAGFTLNLSSAVKITKIEVEATGWLKDTNPALIINGISNNFAAAGDAADAFEPTEVTYSGFSTTATDAISFANNGLGKQRILIGSIKIYAEI